MNDPFDEFELLQDTFTKAWSIYITWFTWFFGLNVVAMGWLVSSNTTNPKYIPPFIVFMETMILLGLVPAFAMYRYRVVARHRGLELLGGRADGRKTVDAVLATTITKIVPASAIVCHGVAAVVWAYIWSISK